MSSDDESDGPLFNGKQVLEMCEKQIKKQDVSHNIKLNQYYFTLQQLFKQAETYNKEGEIERAYIKYKQFCMYFIYTITKHKDYHTPTYAKEKSNNQKLCNDVMDVVEILKEKIQVKHDQNYEYQTKQRAEEKAQREAEKIAKQRADAERAAAAAAASAAAPPSILPTATNLMALPPEMKTAPSTSASAGTSSWDNLRIPTETKQQQQQQQPKPILKKKSVRFNIDTQHRKIHVPASLMQQFMDLAATNTAQTIETCGILTGELRNNELWVTHVIIPKQHGTPNTCVTHDEEELITIQIQHNLLTLGWIHTHPTQACFLSSIDLHTHYSYQIMLPEAVAIVMAPTVTPNYGVFNVTKQGMEILAQCTRTGFHHHGQDGPVLFETANHLVWDHSPTAHRATVIDLRGKDVGGGGGGSVSGGGGHQHSHGHSHGHSHAHTPLQSQLQPQAAAPRAHVPAAVAFPPPPSIPSSTPSYPSAPAPIPTATPSYPSAPPPQVASAPPPAFNPSMLASSPSPSPSPSAPSASVPSAPFDSTPSSTSFSRPSSGGHRPASPPRFNAHMAASTSASAPTFL